MVALNIFYTPRLYRESFIHSAQLLILSYAFKSSVESLESFAEPLKGSVFCVLRQIFGQSFAKENL